MKFLGISFNGKLSADSHILCKLRIASRMIRVLYRLQNTLPLSSMPQLYKALIRPHLEYCSNLLDSATKKSLQLIEKLQARAMKILGCSDPLKENTLPLSSSQCRRLESFVQVLSWSLLKRTSWSCSYSPTLWSSNSPWQC